MVDNVVNGVTFFSDTFGIICENFSDVYQFMANFIIDIPALGLNFNLLEFILLGSIGAYIGVAIGRFFV